MEEDEARLFQRVQARAEERGTVRPVRIGQTLGIHPKRVNQLCKKWKNSGLVDFATPDTVWLTEDGKNYNP